MSKNNEKLMIRKSITLLKEDYDIIKKYSQSINESFSKTMRDLTLTKIKEYEEESLLNFLNNNCIFVSDEEQKEFDNLDIDFNFDKSNVKEVIVS